MNNTVAHRQLRKAASVLAALCISATSFAAPPQLIADVAGEGSIVVRGKELKFNTVAGMLGVRLADPGGQAEPLAEASMSYVAYFQKEKSPNRPITFLFNGGPGSSTMWLHMSGFGPMRVLTQDVAFTAPPYRVVKSAYSFLDSSDLVFIDAPGTGFGQVWGKDKYAFFGVDNDATAFAEFISQFLSRFDRWQSPKYLLGQSYGTTRAAVLVNLLTSGYNIDVNGVVMVAPILNWNLSTKGPQYNPGTDQAYITGLPTYAAVAWYHNRLPGKRPEQVEPFLREVEKFASTDYALALQEGNALAPERRDAIARRMSELIGVSKEYILKADLRLDSGQFRKELLSDRGLTIGMCDGRFSGADIDPQSKEADPEVLPDLQSIVAAYASAVNGYVRGTLRFGGDQPYLVSLGTQGAPGVPPWNFERPQPPAAPTRIFGIANVMRDLAQAMKSNPHLKVMLSGGYYDFCTPYYANQYEIRHLPIPAQLQGNVEFHAFPVGHWPYIHEPTLQVLHDTFADFVRKSDNLP